MIGKLSADKFIYEKNKEDLFRLADQHHGNLRIIADKASIPYTTISAFYKEFPDFKEAVDEARDAFYETASAKLAELINSKNVSAINLFFSKSPQAKAHGWGEKVEQDQNIHLNDAQKAEEAKRLLGLDQPSPDV